VFRRTVVQQHLISSALGLFLLAWSVVGIPADRATPVPLGTMVDVGGYRVHLYCTGTGSPTVVVAGGGFSFDWGLIQPEVAKLTRICTYDPSGTAWSDPYPPVKNRENSAPNCADRVLELHSVLQNAKVAGPYVLVGFSIGGLVERLYARRYPEEVAGMVVVDHAFIDVGSDARPESIVSSKSARAGSGDSPPVLISSTPITMGIEDDRNFNRLPQLNRDLHKWAMSSDPLRPTAESAADCSAVLEDGAPTQSFPLGNRPLVVIRTSNELPGYEQLQAKLLSLSRNSKQVLAEDSTHMVIIDRPDVVTNSIRRVVEAIRADSRLK